MNELEIGARPSVCPESKKVEVLVPKLKKKMLKVLVLSLLTMRSWALVPTSRRQWLGGVVMVPGVALAASDVPSAASYPSWTMLLPVMDLSMALDAWDADSKSGDAARVARAREEIEKLQEG